MSEYAKPEWHLNSSKALPPFGSVKLCIFISPWDSKSICTGVCQLKGNDFLSEWIFAGQFSVGVKQWIDLECIPTPLVLE